MANSHDSTEPVAWMVTSEMQDGTRNTYPLSGRYKDVRDICDFGDPVPLYAAPVAQQLQVMVDMVPPATARDRWMYEQGRLAERDPRTHTAQQPQAEAVQCSVNSVSSRMCEKGTNGCDTQHAPQQAEEVPSDVVRERELRCVIADLTDECKSLRALLEKLIDVEGPQPGTAQWADEVRAAIAQQKGGV